MRKGLLTEFGDAIEAAFGIVNVKRLRQRINRFLDRCDREFDKEEAARQRFVKAEKVETVRVRKELSKELTQLQAVRIVQAGYLKRFRIRTRAGLKADRAKQDACFKHLRGHAKARVKADRAKQGACFKHLRGHAKARVKADRAILAQSIAMNRSEQKKLRRLCDSLEKGLQKTGRSATKALRAERDESSCLVNDLAVAGRRKLRASASDVRRQLRNITNRKQLDRWLSRRLRANGKEQSLADWARETGIAHNTIIMRIDALGWTEEEALTIPVRGHRKGSK